MLGAVLSGTRMTNWSQGRGQTKNDSQTLYESTKKLQHNAREIGAPSCNQIWKGSSRALTHGAQPERTTWPPARIGSRVGCFEKQGPSKGGDLGVLAPGIHDWSQGPDKTFRLDYHQISELQTGSISSCWTTNTQK